MKYLLLFLFSLFCTVNMYSNEKVGLTLIPPGKISNKINLDIRGGIVNRGNSLQTYQVSLFWDKEKKSALFLIAYVKILFVFNLAFQITNKKLEIFIFPFRLIFYFSITLIICKSEAKSRQEPPIKNPFEYFKFLN